MKALQITAIIVAIVFITLLLVRHVHQERLLDRSAEQHTELGQPSNTDAVEVNDAGVVKGVLEHEGYMRSYTLYLPPGYSKENQYPLVFLLHGGGGMGGDFLSRAVMDVKAAEAGFILVVPEGVDGNWNDGRGFTARAATTDTVTEVDDVSFIAALLRTLEVSYAIDSKRVYATGVSNGALMSERLACERPDLFAAIGPVAGPMVRETTGVCPDPTPIPVLGIQGTEDPFFPIYDDDGLPDMPQLLVKQGIEQTPLTVDQITEFWTSVNGCTAAPTITTIPDTAGDGTTATVYSYSNCSSGKDVTYYIINGGGHSWPGGEGEGPVQERLVGKTTQNVSANDVLWDFFKDHSK